MQHRRDEARRIERGEAAQSCCVKIAEWSAASAAGRLHPQKEDGQAEERDTCHQSGSVEWPIGRRCVSLGLGAMS